MLKYNFERIIKARGIEKPFTYFQNAGFSDNFASKIKNNRISRLENKQLERLCLLLKCTPNDLMEWTPDSNTDFDEKHPMHILRKTKTDIDLLKTINSVPLGQLERIEQLIKNEINNLSTTK